jgi:hypothetical protein
VVQKLAVETQTGIQIVGSLLTTGPALPTQVARKMVRIREKTHFSGTRLPTTESVLRSWYYGVGTTELVLRSWYYRVSTTELVLWSRYRYYGVGTGTTEAVPVLRSCY